MRIRLESAGCRLNTGEIDGLARKLLAAGHQVVGPGEAAELCLFNSCSVTAEAARKSSQFIRRLRRVYPRARLIVTGCFSQLSPEEARAAGAEVLIENRDKERTPEILEQAGLLEAAAGVPAESGFAAEVGLAAAHSRTRGFVKVQDGCDNQCAYCVVTVARGPARSRPAQEVIQEINQLTAAGFREVVLSGVHLGSYGCDLGTSASLSRLIELILSATTVPRLRLSSLEPWDVDHRLYELFADPRLLPHLHLPLQSGCDATLCRMARRTSRREYAALVDRIRTAVADIAVSTDVMVGFPGESADEFSQSIAFVERMEFSRLHVFRYSRRPGTAAATMPDQVEGSLVQERSRRMRELAKRLQMRFNQRFVGHTVPVLWETWKLAQAARRRWSGLTGNYIRVLAESADQLDLVNRVTSVELTEAIPGALIGRLDPASPGANS